MRDCALTVQQLAAAPHALVDAARTAFVRLLRDSSYTRWTERQLLCTYIVMHWVVDDNILE